MAYKVKFTAEGTVNGQKFKDGDSINVSESIMKRLVEQEQCAVVIEKIQPKETTKSKSKE